MPEVGNVLFVVKQKSHVVLPVLVVEEISRKTLSGVTTDYVVQFTDKKTIMLSEIDGSTFESSRECKEYLVKQATTAIYSLVLKAEESSRVFIQTSEQQTSEEFTDNIALSSQD